MDATATTIEGLRERLVELHDEQQSVTATADNEKRRLDVEEQKRLDELLLEFDATKAELETRQRIAEQAASLEDGTGRRTTPDDQVGESEERSVVRDVRPAAARDKGRYGWRSFGEFAQGVQRACGDGGTVDQRLEVRAPTTFGQETVGADGGFAVPPDFRDDIMVLVNNEASLLPRTDQLTSSSNSITAPSDETTPWGTTGVYATWEGEGDQLAQRKPSLKQVNARLNKLAVLVPVTDELLEDAGALNTYLRRKAPGAIDFKVNLGIVQGTGAGQPLGILNSPAIVSVAKEGSQVADTVVFNNIIKMWSRCYGPSRGNAVWLINQDIEPQLFTMSFEGTSSSVPAYMPANGLSASPFGTLMGRPVIPTQACETLGDQGDIFLVDLQQYMTATKTTGLRSDVSIHLYFDYDMTAFRFILRLAGLPWWSSTISARDGSTTYSPFVTLDERA
jgi:HK97 family phage major capsid protein